MRRILVLVGVILLSISVLAACKNVDELRTLVDHDKTVTRVVLLLSPT